MSTTEMQSSPMSIDRVGPLLEEYRQVLDERTAIAARDKELSESKERIERLLIEVHEASGLEKLAVGNLSVSFSAAMRAKYDPDKWESIFKWAGESGNAFIIERRLIASRIVPLIEEGVGLPEGLTLEEYTKISFRRK